MDRLRAAEQEPDRNRLIERACKDREQANRQSSPPVEAIYAVFGCRLAFRNNVAVKTATICAVRCSNGCEPAPSKVRGRKC